LTAAFFVVLHSEHDCTGENGGECGVCAQIHVISETLKRFAGGLGFTALMLPFCLFMPASHRLPRLSHAGAGNSLVRAKVRLND
jgi:hypothetical protein